jgi:ATP-binding cassette subfamily C protein
LAGLFGISANVLLLTGPLYMIQIYDRVLPAHSLDTLIVLTGLALTLFALMGVFDFARAMILTRTAARLHTMLEPQVLAVSLNDPPPAPRETPATITDLRALNSLVTSPAITALFDLPFTPVFLLAITLLHPWLGLMAVIGGAILTFVALTGHAVTRRKMARAAHAHEVEQTHSTALQRGRSQLRALGATAAALRHWQNLRGQGHTPTQSSAEFLALTNAIGRSLRIALQSLILGLGAYLALDGRLSPGAMIAASILMGRALAPVDQMIAHWPVIAQGRSAWHRLRPLLNTPRTAPPAMALPVPEARLQVAGLTITYPNSDGPGPITALHNIHFDLAPGEALGVVGPSASGKSTLARALGGEFATPHGTILLGHTPIERYPTAARTRYIGYLPQQVLLFPGTIASNIARLAANTDIDPNQVIAAAKSAGAHDLITALPMGYDTLIGPDHPPLSGGQMQRIGLARALFSQPLIIILDEPNAHLDHDGGLALNAAIRHLKIQGRAVIVMAHRPAALQECDRLLVLEAGRQTALGPRDEVLAHFARASKNTPHILRPDTALRAQNTQSGRSS